MELKHFERLEAKVQELINACSSAKQENERLREVIAQKDGDISALREKLENASKDRSLITERVEALLNKIENLDSM